MGRATAWRLRVGCHLSDDLARWLQAEGVSNLGDGTAELTTRALDQAGLHGLLGRIRDLNLTLLAVEQAG